MLDHSDHRAFRGFAIAYGLTLLGLAWRVWG